MHVLLFPLIIVWIFFANVADAATTERIIVRVNGHDRYDHCKGGPPAELG